MSTFPKATSRRSDSVSVHVLVIDPGHYCKRVWCAIGVGFTHIFIGATLMTILMFYLSMGDLHAILYTIAYHFFTAEAILSFNYANGWSAPLQLRHRRFAHIFLQVCGIVCAITGTLLICISKGISGNVHGVMGIATAVLHVISFIIGAFVLYYRERYFRLVHTGFGIPTFLLSSVSLCTALFTPDFKNWTNDAVIFILIGFIIFYSAFILVTCFMKCIIHFIKQESLLKSTYLH